MYRGMLKGCLAVGLLFGVTTGPARAEDNAVIEGKVIFKGNANDPKFRRTVLNTAKDPNCAKHKAKIGSWSVILNKKTDPVTVRNVMVFVKEGLDDRKFEVPSTPVTLVQNGCEYTPHVFGLMAGQTLIVKNEDETNHNIHFQPKVNTEENFTQPKAGMTRELKFEAETTPFHIKCDVHPWMGAYMAVFKHPFFAVTDNTGTYKIEGLPPGKYVLEAWHEEFGTEEMTVEVASGETKEADFTYQPK